MKKIIIILGVLLATVVAGVGAYFLINNKQEVVEVDKFQQTYDKVNDYQQRYFEIIKRNNALLKLSNDDEEAMKDLMELKALFAEAKNDIKKDCKFLSEYEKNKELYRTNTGENTLEMNEFARKKYEVFDKLLNDTYKEVKSQLSEEDFEKVKISQRAWLKEVEDYNKVFVAQEFGTIATLVKYDYEINMRGFRTLLLMMYLNIEAQNPIEPKDFVGQWSEVSAGRIYVNVEKKLNKFKVTYGGANSAYSHSESIYDCKFDEKTTSLVCSGAKHTNQFMSCKGISSDEDMTGYLECAEKYPEEEKEDYKTFTDDKIRTILIRKGSKSRHIVDDEEYFDKNKKDEIKNNYENMGLYFDDDKDTVYYKYKG